MQQDVFIGLGANLAEPIAQLERAVQALRQHPELQLHRLSSFYGSKPMGPQDQPDYVNAVAWLKTSLAPEPLLDVLQAIELAQGRQRKDERWGPRTLDLDILLYGELQLASPRLTLPHYGMASREFVLYPLAEIAPELLVPGLGSVSALVAKVPRNGLTILETPTLN